MHLRGRYVPMATTMSKRQQARNERQLQDLIQNVPGNDRCADCGARNPGWASWNLGIFLCVRCASLHRKLGTHVSKVKSLSMDAWSTEQVDNMKKMGNVRSNANYNPQNTRADVPIDADEVDAAVERFIRQKYESRTLSTNRPAARQDTGSTGTGSWNEEPPPLPPKPKKFFSSLRSASSTIHRPKNDRSTPVSSPVSATDDRATFDTPKTSGKPSQVFGMRITSVSNNFDQKLATLRDMGFSDSRKNSEILKSSNGNLDKAVETLVRLGEGSKPQTPGQTSAARTLTPVSGAGAADNGTDFPSSGQAESATDTVSNNPWMVRQAAPQRSVSQPVPQSSPPARSQSAGPPSNSWNPFAADSSQAQSVQSLENTFQTLQVSQTGPTSQQQPTSAFSIPNVPQVPQQYQAHVVQPQQASFNPWLNQQQQQLSIQQPQTTAAPFSQLPMFQQQNTGATSPYQSSNPFMPSYTSQTVPPPANPWNPPPTASPVTMTQQSSPWTSQSHSPAPMMQQSNSPFMPSPSASPWPPQQQGPILQEPSTQSPAPMVGQQAYFTQQQPQQPFAPQPPFAQNPWQQHMAPSPAPPQYPQQQQQQQVSQQPLPQPIRHDKTSILALYNMPHLAPRQPLQTLQEDPNAVPQPAVAQRSVTMPVQFPTSNVNVMPQNTQSIRHVSSESRDFVNLGGRHSPDAFAGLSAQYMR